MFTKWAIVRFKKENDMEKSIVVYQGRGYNRVKNILTYLNDIEEDNSVYYTMSYKLCKKLNLKEEKINIKLLSCLNLERTKRNKKIWN